MGSHSLELIMNGLVVLAACVCASSAQLVARAVLPTHQAHQFHAQDEFGQFSFGHAGGPSARTESRDAYGVTTGSYQYMDAYGLIQTVNYISDAAGFRVVGTNLPTGPVVPATAPLVGPAPVVETPEVAAARAEFEAAFEAAAAAAAAAPEVVEVAVEEAAPAEVVAERKKRQAILPALAYNGLHAGYNGLLAPYPLAAHGLLAGTPAEIVANVELPVATVKAAEAVEAPVVAAAAAPVAAALPLAGAYALPAPAVAAR